MNQIDQNKKNPSTQKGKLFVVATPIGNLADISSRALETLKTVDVIACEDTRHTKKLCNAFNITTPLTSYYREKEQVKSERLLASLDAGKNIALVSDAGTPAISDPGAVLVKKARSSGIDIIPIAGPSAITTALSVAGITESSFFFGGFLPAKKSERRKKISELRSLPYPLVFYESPHRINTTIKDLGAILGQREAQLFRELTKIHEECISSTLPELLTATQGKIKGELVLIVSGAPAVKEQKPEQIEDLILWYKNAQQQTLKETVRMISSDLDIPRSKVYKLALQIWDTDQI